jgi:hypothetical protein
VARSCPERGWSSGVPERTGGVPEVWELVSAEMDGNGLTVDLRRKDGHTMTFGFRVTSEAAVTVFRTISDAVGNELSRLGTLGVVLAPIEPVNASEEYREDLG